jgi:MFS family permease
MNQVLSTIPALEKPTRVRYGVLAFTAVLSMITYLDRVCFGTVAPLIQDEFGLSDTQKGMLFSAFALAYAVFEVPSGWLGDVFGPRRTLIRIVLWWSVFTALTGMIAPIAAWPWFAFTAMLTVRFLFGVGEAGAYPNITRSFHSWFPFTQRGFAQGVVWMAGRFGGGITSFVVLALFYETVVGDKTVTHWRHVFWLFGFLGVIWCVGWWWWFKDRPEQNPSVNQAELALIHGASSLSLPPSEPAESQWAKVQQEHIRQVEDRIGHGEEGRPLEAPTVVERDVVLPHEDAGHRNVPWERLLTSGNLWTLCAMYFCAAYGWYFNITWLPGYLKEEYGVSKDSWGFWTTSLMTGAPLLLGSAACLLGGLLTDGFIRRTGNRKWGRRVFGVTGHGLCALCYFLSFYARNPWLFVLAIALAAFANDLTMGSAWAVCLDIGKRYSGIVSGCMNTVGNLGGFVAGTATGLILEHFGKQAGWTVNFLTFGGVYVAAALLWLRIDSTKPIVDGGM